MKPLLRSWGGEYKETERDGMSGARTDKRSIPITDHHER